MDAGTTNNNNNNSIGDEPMPVQTIKLVLFGASRTGKTALLRRFLDNKFEERYVETVEEMYRKNFSIRDRKFNVCFYDMGGSNEFPAMRRVLVGDANGFIIVCSADVSDSYDQMVNAWHEISMAKRTPDQLDKTPCVIVLAKTDMSLNDAANLEAKQVLTSRINNWIDANMLASTSLRKKTLAFTEISSRTGFNIKSPFEKLADQMLPPSVGGDGVKGGDNVGSDGSALSNTAIGVLAAKSAAPDSPSLKPPPAPAPKRGFSLYRRKTAEDKDKSKDKPTTDDKEPKKLDRAKTSSKSFIFKGSSNRSGSSQHHEQKQSAATADDDCCLQ